MFLETNTFRNFDNSGILSIDDLSPKLTPNHPNAVFKEIRILDPNAKLVHDKNFGIREEMDQSAISQIRESLQVRGWVTTEGLIEVSEDGYLLNGRTRWDAMKPLYPNGIPVAVYEVDDYSPDVMRDIGHWFNGETLPTARFKMNDYVGDLLLCVKEGKAGEDPTEDDIRTYAQSRAWAKRTSIGNVTKIAKEAYRRYSVGEDLVRIMEKEDWEEWLEEVMPVDSWEGLDPSLRAYTVVSQSDQTHRPGTIALGCIRHAYKNNQTLKIVLYSKRPFPKDVIKSYKNFARALNHFVRDFGLNRKPYEIFVVPQINGRFDEEFDKKQIIPLDEV